MNGDDALQIYPYFLNQGILGIPLPRFQTNPHPPRCQGIPEVRMCLRGRRLDANGNIIEFSKRDCVSSQPSICWQNNAPQVFGLFSYIFTEKSPPRIRWRKMLDAISSLHLAAEQPAGSSRTVLQVLISIRKWTLASALKIVSKPRSRAHDIKRSKLLSPKLEGIYKKRANHLLVPLEKLRKSLPENYPTCHAHISSVQP